jgi:hypothetical protein
LVMSKVDCAFDRTRLLDGLFIGRLPLLVSL